MGPDFKEAIRKVHDLLRRGTWRLVERNKAQGSPLPLKWVFTYKFDQDGYLQGAKLGSAQFDVGNAFLYSDLKKDHPVYVRPSPLLWYNEISQALKEAGIDRTDEERVFTNGKILALVYVDDILILNPRQEKKAVNDLVQHLQSKYDLREEEFKWYLGIRL
ncbi:reverse transcriptase (RNA-dependent DNA polymerase) domain-containing protein [Hirsutella rhossiliensis]|uniref:Reverse transcriptase (RNA-dependent DNA polymerase) domain-containing protein n=1 Tax=Hirsutella rhossiliensis TaxID=111463 RepID=A0A9P8SG81_9HYPO|nr:reverse transcriptase (RNA-dependent DNA polymerase) domain-containing protein [Hirsutella rhossiliensis]KAH0959751.1 reverse transcriptase (RNA-dependent DNA polymerase) domain-containing protein [Hirsutella rhossiliensis]